MPVFTGPLPATPHFLEKPRCFFLCQETISKVRHLSPHMQWPPVLTTPHGFAQAGKVMARKTRGARQRGSGHGRDGTRSLSRSCALKKNIPFYFSFSCRRASKHALVITVVCRISCGSQPDGHSLLKSLLWRVYPAPFQDIEGFVLSLDTLGAKKKKIFFFC